MALFSFIHRSNLQLSVSKDKPLERLSCILFLLWQLSLPLLCLHHASFHRQRFLPSAASVVPCAWLLKLFPVESLYRGAGKKIWKANYLSNEKSIDDYLLNISIFLSTKIIEPTEVKAGFSCLLKGVYNLSGSLSNVSVPRWDPTATNCPFSCTFTTSKPSSTTWHQY